MSVEFRILSMFLPHITVKNTNIIVHIFSFYLLDRRKDKFEKKKISFASELILVKKNKIKYEKIAS